MSIKLMNEGLDNIIHRSCIIENKEDNKLSKNYLKEINDCLNDNSYDYSDIDEEEIDAIAEEVCKEVFNLDYYTCDEKISDAVFNAIMDRVDADKNYNNMVDWHNATYEDSYLTAKEIISMLHDGRKKEAEFNARANYIAAIRMIEYEYFDHDEDGISEVEDLVDTIETLSYYFPDVITKKDAKNIEDSAKVYYYN